MGSVPTSARAAVRLKLSAVSYGLMWNAAVTVLPVLPAARAWAVSVSAPRLSARPFKRPVKWNL